ncbi:MAG: YDG domain-containing protein [Candidatus Symbiothrix sp.]|jgi:hypothetical protein|nr:YDG domain-containing protein [Candidatus Symbiothrix sp.]
MKKALLLTIVCLLSALGSFAQTYSGGTGTLLDPWIITSKADMEALATTVNAGNNQSGKYFLLTQNLTGITTVIGTSYSFRGFFDGGGHTVGVNINISSNGPSNAGVFGVINNATIKNLGVTGSVIATGSNVYIGGICAKATGTNTIDNCYNQGVIDGTATSTNKAQFISYAAGICGDAGDQTTISNCSNSGTIQGFTTHTNVAYASASGICGHAWGDVTISNCFNTGTIRGTIAAAYDAPSNEAKSDAYASGVCAWADGENVTISNCYNTGIISAITQSSENSFAVAGGISAYTKSAKISNSYNAGFVITMSSTLANSYSGGICGDLQETGKINNCFAANTEIKASSDGNIGRIVGKMNLENVTATIAKCYALSSMKLNGAPVISTDMTSRNGYDVPFLASFQTQSWIASNLQWNFSSVWQMPTPSGLPVLIPVVNPKTAITISGIVVSNKEYNGDTNANVSNWGNLTGGKDPNYPDVSVDYDGVTSYFVSKNIGIREVLLSKPLALKGTDAAHYELIQPTGLKATITQRTSTPLTINGLQIANKEYDGNTTAKINVLGTLNGVFGSDDVGIDSAGVKVSFSDKNVGSGKLITFSQDFKLKGSDAANYTLAQPTDITANITPRNTAGKLTITGLTIANKEYDGTTNATVSNWGTLNGITPGDDVQMDYRDINAFFDTKDVGNNKVVTLSGDIQLIGRDAENYLLEQPTGLTANITNLEEGILKVVGLTIKDKEYDGTTVAEISSWGELIGVKAGDVVTMIHTGVTAAFNDKNVGENKPVTLSGTITLGGPDAGNYTLVQPTGLKANITPKASLTTALTITGLKVNNKEYDGTTLATINTWGTLAGVIGDDNVTINSTGVTLSFNDKEVGAHKPITLSKNLTLGGPDAGNYVLIQPTDIFADILPRTVELTLVGFAIKDKLWDGTTYAEVENWGTLQGVESGDVVNINTTGVTAAFEDAEVGENKPVHLIGTITLAGPSAGNYTGIVQPEGLTATILPLPDENNELRIIYLTIADKEYDGNTNATVSDWGVLSGLKPGDDVEMDYEGITASFADKNVGSGKPVTLSEDIRIKGDDAHNYILTQPTDLTASITPRASTGKALTIDNFLISNKEYDGTAMAAVGSWGTLAGVDGDDDVTLVYTGITASFNDKNAGNNKPVTLSGNITLGGADAANYTLIQPAGLMANISPFNSLTIDGITIANKRYDGTTQATVSSWGTLQGVLDGDVVTINATGVEAVFADKEEGENKPVSFIGTITLAGPDAANYTLTQPTGITGTIDPQIIDGILKIVGMKIADKEYDGTTDATVANWGELSGIKIGENVTMVYTGVTASFADKNVGAGKPVTLNGEITLAGIDASKYILSQPEGLTASITPRASDGKALTLDGFMISNKEYDGTAVAAVGNWGTLVGLDDGDVVTINHEGINASFNDKNVGTDKPVTLSGNITLSGADAANYTLIQPSGLKANILPRNSAETALTITGLTIADKEYDGLTVATVSDWGTLQNLLDGDIVTINGTGVTAEFDDKNVGENKPVTLIGVLTLAGPDAGNYGLIQPTGITGTITPQGDSGVLRVVGMKIANKEYDGTIDATVSDWGQLAGIKPGDEVMMNHEGVTASFLDKNVGDSKPVFLNGNITLSGADAGNYTLTQPDGLTATILPRTSPDKALTIAGLTIANKEYDGTTVATVSSWGELVGVAEGDDVQMNHTGITALFYDKNVGIDKPVILSGNITLTGADAANYTLIQPTDLKANIIPQSAGGTLTITGLTVADKEYDGNTNATVSEWGTLSGVISGDDVTINATGVLAAFDTKNVGADKPVTLIGTIKLSGADAEKYNLTPPTDLVAGITPKTILVEANPVNKTYGNADPALTYTYTPNLIGSDVLTGALTREPGELTGDYQILQGTVSANSNYTIDFRGALFTIIGQGSEAEILDLTINGVSLDISDPDNIVYTLPCGITQVTVQTETVNNGTVMANGEIPLPYVFKPTVGSNSFTLTVTSQNGSQTKNYTVTVISSTSGLVVQMWDAVLSVVNVPENNGGYTFVAYQWQEDGVDMLGETGGNLYLADNPKAQTSVYTVKLTTGTGQQLLSCPMSLGTGLKSATIQVYPNPVSQKAIVQSSDIKAGDKLELYDLNGKLIQVYKAGGSRTEIVLPALEKGSYILKAANGQAKLLKQ